MLLLLIHIRYSYFCQRNATAGKVRPFANLKCCRRILSSLINILSYKGKTKNNYAKLFRKKNPDPFFRIGILFSLFIFFQIYLANFARSSGTFSPSFSACALLMLGVKSFWKAMGMSWGFALPLRMSAAISPLVTPS